mgnify:CR=1 FL=1
MSNVNMWEIEEGFYAQGVKIICGIDEAGRGPLAGPVCAAAVILRTYIKKYRCDTIAKIIARFAPTNENNTEAYISRVEDLTGIDRNKKLKFSDKTAICSILQAMSVVELGGSYITYTDVETGYGLANAENPY